MKKQHSYANHCSIVSIPIHLLQETIFVLFLWILFVCVNEWVYKLPNQTNERKKNFEKWMIKCECLCSLSFFISRSGCKCVFVRTFCSIEVTILLSYAKLHTNKRCYEAEQSPWYLCVSIFIQCINMTIVFSIYCYRIENRMKSHQLLIDFIFDVKLFEFFSNAELMSDGKNYECKSYKICTFVNKWCV